MSRKIDVAGQKFNALTAIREDGRQGKQIVWLCSCDCGNETRVASYDLRNNKTKSCGCLQHEGTHGRTDTSEYRTWASMIQRCTNPNRKEYPYYGGRGIRICDRWINDFAAFFEDVGQKPDPSYSLDRINCDGHYEPTNVRWATPLEQWENRKTRGMTFDHYQHETHKTAIYPSDTQVETVIYCTLGLASEAGEVCGKVKKVIRDNGYELTANVRKKIIDEMGDTMWYLSELASSLDVSLEIIAQRNLTKLASRRERGVVGGDGDDR